MPHVNNKAGLGKSQQTSHVKSQTGQNHERDQLRGAFAGEQNENDLSHQDTKEKNRKLKANHATGDRGEKNES